MDTRENISRHTQGLPNDNITPGIPNDNITPEVGVLVKQQRSDSLTKHIEPHTETMGASLNSINESTRPRLTASSRAEAATTPKRKLSPIESTPTGRQRKLSTTAYNSPKLRGAVETAGGLLSLRGNIDASPVQQPRTPEKPSSRPEQAADQRPVPGTTNPPPHRHHQPHPTSLHASEEPRGRWPENQNTLTGLQQQKSTTRKEIEN